MLTLDKPRRRVWSLGTAGAAALALWWLLDDSSPGEAQVILAQPPVARPSGALPAHVAADPFGARAWGSGAQTAAGHAQPAPVAEPSPFGTDAPARRALRTPAEPAPSSVLPFSPPTAPGSVTELSDPERAQDENSG